MHVVSLQSAKLHESKRYFIGLIFFWTYLLMASEAWAAYRITQVKLEGLKRTQADWLLSYTNLNCPCEIDGEAIENIRIKLLTSQVFQDVTIAVRPEPGQTDIFILDIRVLEKWTIIPVVRGAFGGGTPLLVAGIYDTHAFGSLWTLGAETRTFGSAPTGGVAWVRAPRWLGGSHYLNFEVWRDNRIRSVYDKQDKEVGSIYGSGTALISEVLVPLSKSGHSPWQIGLRLMGRTQSTLEWHEQEAQTRAYEFDLNPINQKRLLARLVYDDMAVQQLNLQGLRLLLHAGPTWSDKKYTKSLEQEIFWYGLWQKDWNLSFHQWLGLSDDRSYQSLYFLGGFDSVRGLPDGVMYGNKAIYANIELRKIVHRSQYAWWQAAVYSDFGAAGFSTKEWMDHDRKSWGLGLRIAVPQVNRLVFRADYAWSLGQPKTSSFSIGMNQFIDPYRPL